MRLSFSFTYCFLLCLLFFTSYTYAQSAQDKLSAHLQNFTALQANFSQRIENNAGVTLQHNSA
jgi:outer membrane lipoprotein-sorting protein